MNITCRYDGPIGCACGDRRAVDNAYVEKPTLLEILGRQRHLWAELPFCSNCHAGFFKTPGCDQHEFDTYAFKCLPFKGSEHSLSFGNFKDPDKLLPTDVQRPMTDAEKTRVNGYWQERAEKERTKSAEKITP